MKPFKLPSREAALAPITSHPLYQVEHEKRSKLREKKRELEAELRDAEQRLQAMLMADEGEESDRLAASLVTGLGEALGVADTREALTARIGDLRLRIGGYRKADLALAKILGDMRAELSVSAAKSLQPAMQAAAANALKAIEGMRAAIADMQTVRAELTDKGYDALLPDFADNPFLQPGGYQQTGTAQQLHWERRLREYTA
jgi:hypothetical protein